MSSKLVAALLFILSGTHDPVKEQILGTWKGAYGTQHQIIDITVSIYSNNKTILTQTVDGFINSGVGSYQLQGDTAILINVSLPEKKPLDVQLHGYLNRTVTFISGDWDSNVSEGSFFLQKQGSSLK
jgi:hypothetical protein